DDDDDDHEHFLARFWEKLTVFLAFATCFSMEMTSLVLAAQEVKQSNVPRRQGKAIYVYVFASRPIALLTICAITIWYLKMRFCG
ncbi:unnamed protein product, partial [Rotaria magnacalcarata]